MVTQFLIYHGVIILKDETEVRNNNVEGSNIYCDTMFEYRTNKTNKIHHKQTLSLYPPPLWFSSSVSLQTAEVFTTLMQIVCVVTLGNLHAFVRKSNVSLQVRYIELVKM